MPTPAEVLEQLAEGDSLDDDMGEAREVALLLVREAFRRVEAVQGLDRVCGFEDEEDTRNMVAAEAAREALNRMHVHLGGQCIPGVEQEMLARAWEEGQWGIDLVLDVPALSEAQTRDHAELPQVQLTSLGYLQRNPDGIYEVIHDDDFDELRDRLRPVI